MSVPDAIAKVLRRHFIIPEEKKNADGDGTPVEVIVAKANGSAGKASADLMLEQCPECGDRALAFESGCVTCRSCGFSKCS